MTIAQALKHDVAKLRRVHRDERGTISIVSVFSLIILAMLLGMVLNVGFQANNKVEMQNAADAAAYSGGVMMARGMNTLAFTNHLLADVFAMTAFMREAVDNRGIEYVPEILAAWNEVAPEFTYDGFRQFDNWQGLTEGIQNKSPKEQEMVDAFSEWANSLSEKMLPTFEQILEGELIPRYQRALVETIPEVAQAATNTIAQAHGKRSNGSNDDQRGPLQGGLWRGDGETITSSSGPATRSLPVVDPVWDSMPRQDYYLAYAKTWRNQRATEYLRTWNNENLAPFRYIGGQSQYFMLWSSFTCCRLMNLFYENENRNLPFVIRTEPPELIQAAMTAYEQEPERILHNNFNIRRFMVEHTPSDEINDYLGGSFMFVGTTYWPNIEHALPGLFKTPFDGDNVTYAQVEMFIPRNRLPNSDRRQSRPTSWDLSNQSWRVQLVPATHPALLTILRTQPTFSGDDQLPTQEVELPDLSGVSEDDIQMISHH
jgi:Flp pilus assembly protein TadG